MKKINVTIEVTSPIHLSSGRANVSLDADIVHDALGFPYFPAKRFKGLLYESALEIFEMFELSGLDTKNLAPLEEIFHRHSSGDVQLIVPNFFIFPIDEYENFSDEWKYLLATYPEIFTPEEILRSFTSVRYQTKLEDGVAADRSLRNLRVLDAGTKFFGEILVRNADKKVLNVLALAFKNLSAAGMKRNRGFGQIKCSADFGGATADELAQKFFAKEA